jgi:hypothetical protein
MKIVLRLLLVIGLLGSALPVFAQKDIGNIIKAQIILSKVMELSAKMKEQSVELIAPDPIPDSSGRYLLPYDNDGNLTEWAEKSLSAQAGAAVGAKAGEHAGRALASKVPFGGLAAGAMKGKSKEIGALTAIGGAEFVKKTSTQSFNNLDDYSVYLHVMHGGTAGHEKALAAAMAIYPALENGYDASVRKAYQQGARAQRAAK